MENIKKIAYLRTLGIPVEDIRRIISKKVTLQETLERQNEVLKSQITDLNKAKLMCEKMLDEESISYEKLQVEKYVTELHDYWKDNQTVFKLDSVSFLYIWGSMLTWTTITALCLIIGALSYSNHCHSEGTSPVTVRRPYPGLLSGVFRFQGHDCRLCHL